MAEISTDDLATVVQVSCGSSHTVALLDCNIVASWGRGEDGQLGHGDAEQCVAPKAIHSLLHKDISSICCGAEYTIAVSAKHQHVYSWGWGDFGRLGHGDCTDVFVPQQITFFNSMAVQQVACGDTHTLVSTVDGKLYTFGRNQNGQLGHGNTNDVLSPKMVEELQGKFVTSVAAGAEHSAIATSDGEMYAWGWGRYGNLGDGERVDRHSPARVSGLDGLPVTHVACGWRHSAAVTDAGRVYSFGWSKYGQLGHGDHDDRVVPAEVAGLSGRVVVQIAGGWRHTMALDQEGTVWAWGWNKFGQLGLGHNDDQAAPVAVEALAGKPVALLACGWRHTVAITKAGEVYSWGRGVNGQLGHGQEADETLPSILRSLCKGVATKSALVATATAVGGYVAPADRYAVVPNGGDCLVPGSSTAAAGQHVPGSSRNGALLHGGPDGMAGAPASKKARVVPAAGANIEDAAVPGS
eukprot:GHRR01006391.1.p1 GENE.GHRR01006391.1~~GHRR01006391.1.p1  ORF type:complete len:467 (+),score=165.58 GHRR01006391.1:204-1604(+)